MRHSENISITFNKILKIATEFKGKRTAMPVRASRYVKTNNG